MKSLDGTKQVSPHEYEKVKARQERMKRAQDWLMEEGNNFCAIPYAHMAIEANGAIRPCCIGRPFTNLSIKGKTIGEAFDHPTRQDFIDAFDRNEQHPQCAVCWKDNNRFNNRVRFSTNQEIIHVTEAKMNGEEPKRELKWLEIKPGNRCNLKCRICGVHNSSMWTKDYYEMVDYFHSMDPDYGQKPTFKESPSYKWTESCKWIDEGDFWKQVNGLETLNMIHFMGGEPFMVPEHFILLQQMIDAPHINTKDIIIRYNTNGTYFPNDDQLVIWKQFKRVLLHISIDDIGERFEYQRNLAEWESVKQNLLNFRRLDIETMDNDGWKLKALLDPTISLYNIWNVEEIESGFNELGYHLNLGNRHFVNTGWNDARVLPQEAKDIILEKFKDSTSQWVRAVMDYLQTPQAKMREKHDITTAYKQIMYLDSLRNENFKKLYPELYELILPHIDWNRVNPHKQMTKVRYE